MVLIPFDATGVCVTNVCREVAIDEVSTESIFVNVGANVVEEAIIYVSEIVLVFHVVPSLRALLLCHNTGVPEFKISQCYSTSFASNTQT